MSDAQPVLARRWWPWLRRLLALLFFVGVASLVYSQIRNVQWTAVMATLGRQPIESLLGAAACAAASYALYSCFDLLGRHLTAHALGTRKVMAVNFISYAFDLNIGALLGGIAFRYRLYARLGLATEVITRVIAMTLLTNWLGYLLLAGLVFLFWPWLPLPRWQIDARLLQLFGGVLFAIAMAYLLLCGKARRRRWQLRGYDMILPSLRIALLQLGMSSLNWLLMAATIFTLLEQRIAFSAVLAALFASAIAGVLAHVPAGLGVLEAVFVALLSHQLPKTDLLAALLAYRAIYYLMPLALAVAAYLVIEARMVKGAATPPLK